MFESLSDRLGASLKAISGKSKLTEDNIRDTLRDVHRSNAAMLRENASGFFCDPRTRRLRQSKDEWHHCGIHSGNGGSHGAQIVW